MTSLAYNEYFFEFVNDSVMTRTMDGIIDFWNRSAEKLYGWRKEEAVGRVSHDLLQTRFPKPLEEIESELVRNGLWEGWLVHTTRDGRRVVVKSRWVLEVEKQSGAVVEINTRSTPSTVETTTERKQAPSVLEQAVTTLHQHKFYFELVNDSVMTRTMEGIIDFWNRSAEKLYGWSKEEAINRVSHDLLQTRFPKPLEEIQSELVKWGRWEGKLVHATRDSGRVEVQSRWILNPTVQPPAVLEINALVAGREIDRESRTGGDSVEVGRQEPAPASKVMKVDDLLLQFANVVLAGGALLCILALFYVIYYYEQTADGRFSTPFGIALYWIFPALLASLLFAFLRRHRGFKLNAALLSASIAVSVYATELTLGIYHWASRPSVTFWGDGSYAHMQEIVALAKKFGVDFDVRTKLEVIKDLREKGINAVPATIPFALLMQQPDDKFKSMIAVDGKEVLPLGGISNRVTVLCNEIGKHVIYESDERGFHNPKGIWGTNPITVAAVGDSFTAGACVPSDKNFVSVIREHYPNSVNLGMLGEGPLIMLATLKEYLPFLKPKVVLWFFFEENDFRDLLKEGETPLLRNYLQDDFKQGLFHRQTDIDQALAAYFEEAIKTAEAKPKTDQSFLGPLGLADRNDTLEDTKDASSSAMALKIFVKLGYLRQTLRAFFDPTVRQREENEYSQAQLNLFRDVLSKANESVGMWNGTLYFVYLPARDRYAKKADYNRQSILAIVKDTGIPIIDVHRRFQLQSDPLSLFPFGRFGHYNEEGNRLVAEEVLRSIAQKPE